MTPLDQVLVTGESGFIAPYCLVGLKKKGLELAAINVVGLLGSVLGTDYCYSIPFINQMLTSQLKGVSKMTSVYSTVPAQSGDFRTGHC